ncbi:MAG: Spy/CpxP family protein refolding chaperone [Thermodesulfobacteriota bacterium]
MNKKILIVGMCIIALAVASTGFAWGPDRGGDCPGKRSPGAGCNQKGGAWGLNLSDEQREKIDGLRQKFIDESAALRIQINTASEKVALLMETSKPDKQAVKNAVKELSDLQAQLVQKHIDHVLAVKEVVPEAGKRMGFQGTGMMNGPCFGFGYCQR